MFKALWGSAGRKGSRIKVADPGNELSMYYNEELRCWVEPGKEEEMKAQLEEKSSGPPSGGSSSVTATQQRKDQRELGNRYVDPGAFSSSAEERVSPEPVFGKLVPSTRQAMSAAAVFVPTTPAKAETEAVNGGEAVNQKKDSEGESVEETTFQEDERTEEVIGHVQKGDASAEVESLEERTQVGGYGEGGTVEDGGQVQAVVANEEQQTYGWIYEAWTDEQWTALYQYLDENYGREAWEIWDQETWNSFWEYWWASTQSQGISGEDHVGIETHASHEREGSEGDKWAPEEEPNNNNSSLVNGHQQVNGYSNGKGGWSQFVHTMSGVDVLQTLADVQDLLAELETLDGRIAHRKQNVEVQLSRIISAIRGILPEKIDSSGQMIPLNGSIVPEKGLEGVESAGACNNAKQLQSEESTPLKNISMEDEGIGDNTQIPPPNVSTRSDNGLVLGITSENESTDHRTLAHEDSSEQQNGRSVGVVSERTQEENGKCFSNDSSLIQNEDFVGVASVRLEKYSQELPPKQRSVSSDKSAPAAMHTRLSTYQEDLDDLCLALGIECKKVELLMEECKRYGINAAALVDQVEGVELGEKGGLPNGKHLARPRESSASISQEDPALSHLQGGQASW